MIQYDIEMSKGLTFVKFLWFNLLRLNRSSISGYLLYKRTKSIIEKHLPNNAVIVEAGAHKGTDTAEMAYKWPGTTIHAFEPVPEIYKILNQNTDIYPNVKTYQLALSDSNGSAKFHTSEGTSDESGSLLIPKEHLKIHPTVKFNKEIKVRTVMLDSWAKENNISKVDFMWLDMQGMELKVLKKSKIIFPNVKLLYTEINLKETYKGVGLYSEYKQWLISNGMTLIFENIYWKDSGNALFLRRPNKLSK